MNAHTARSVLGVGKTSFRGLIDSGLVAAIDDGHGNERFREGDIARLLESVCGEAPTVEVTPSGCIPLREASRKFGIPVAELVRRIVASELPVVGTLRKMKVLSGVLVLADGLVRAARKTEDGLTLQEAAGRLGMHPEAVLHVARTGLLPGRREGRGWRFTMSEVESFDAEHVTGARMAALLGTSPRSAIARLGR